MLEIRNVLILVSIIGYCKVESCQPELVEDAADLVSVGYDRLSTTSIYVDTISVDMKNKQKFSKLLTGSCNRRKDVALKLAIRKQGSQDWDEMKRDISITLKHNDGFTKIDPCQIY